MVATNSAKLNIRPYETAHYDGIRIYTVYIELFWEFLLNFIRLKGQRTRCCIIESLPHYNKGIVEDVCITDIDAHFVKVMQNNKIALVDSTNNMRNPDHRHLG